METVTFKDCMKSREKCQSDIHGKIDRLTLFIFGNVILTTLTLISNII